MDTMIPPIMPATRPEYTGVLEASEMPRQRGRATKNTVMLALRSCLIKESR
jgi:hypothetical protein